MSLLPQSGVQAGTETLDDGGDRRLCLRFRKSALSILENKPEGKAFLFN